MRILYILASPTDFRGGCYFYRQKLPGKYLVKKGHRVSEAVIGVEIKPDLLEKADVVIFSRTYAVDPLKPMRQCKAAGKYVIYEVDDCL